MRIRIKSLALQIWLSFLILALILGVWMLLFLRAEKKSENLSIFSFSLTSTHNFFSENVINYQDFILTGYKDPKFYISGEQKDIHNYLSNLEKVQKKLSKLEKDSKNYTLNTSEDFELLMQLNEELLKQGQSLRELMKFRGFKDYGVEGTMRESAHALEDSSKILRSEILQLRRHEKDYLLRGEKLYFEEFDTLNNKLKRKYSNNKLVAGLLENYKNSFDRYVEISERLGFYSDSGLLGRIDLLHNRVNSLFSSIKDKSSNRILELNQEHSNFLIFQTVFIGFIAILVSLFLAKTLTHDIKLLNENFRYYIRSGFLGNPNKDLVKPDFKLSSIEIRKLFVNFQLLKETLNNTIKQLNEEVEKSARAANYKARFLANMSHEIRTPLNGILGMLQLIRIDQLSEKQQKNLDVAEYSANHLLEVVNMILDHSKLEVGKMKVDNRPVDLKLLFKNIHGIFDYQAKEKNLDFRIVFDDRIQHKVYADSMRLQQVFMNLISNAVKFTDLGFVEFKAERIIEDSKTLSVEFAVTDSGIGINLKNQTKLFEAFEQQDVSTTRKHGGTGLGLTITNQLVELMGGELSLLSGPGQGSKFYFSLEFKKVLEKSDFLDPIILYNDKLEVDTQKVLVVEDNKINQLVLDKMLRKIGVCSLLAENGQDAYDLFIKEDFDLILMDIHMPKMNGLEATRLIKSHPKYITQSPPIIAITASAFEEDRTEALDRGMDDFITKPILFDNLQQILKKYLSLKIV